MPALMMMMMMVFHVTLKRFFTGVCFGDVRLESGIFPRILVYYYFYPYGLTCA